MTELDAFQVSGASPPAAARLDLAHLARRSGSETAGTPAPVAKGTKRCPRCGEMQALDAFSKNRCERDGRQRWCRGCMAQTKSHCPGAPASMSGTTGALLELLAMADAIRKGFCVSRTVSGSAPYDLVLDDGERLWRVEVKARSKRARARLGEKCDGLITVDPQNTIEWFWAPRVAPIVQPHGDASIHDLVLDDGARLLHARVRGKGRATNALVVQRAITYFMQTGFRVSRPLPKGTAA